jgi:hypothetical protein
VLEIHIPGKHVTSIIPRSSSRGRSPKSRTVFRAIRECRFHFTIAIEKMKPPRRTIEVSVHI